jgi:biotin-dependent carboxylase-like uncharacterized protein
MSPDRGLEVLEPGLLTTVQDAGGRPGWRHLGVPIGGAADPLSAVLANRLVGNADVAAVIEITLVGPSLLVHGPGIVALGGADLSATLDATPLPPGAARAYRDGSILRFGERRRGTRTYVALGGGIDVVPVLGSRSTDLRTGFGGHHGRALRAGDRLALGEPAPTAVPRRLASAPPTDDGPIRILPGPHAARFGPDAVGMLVAADWTVGPEADRAGVRLDGGRLRHRSPDDAEVPSLGLPAGAIQVPLDGRPIVMLADRPVTGGYAVLACVATADVGRVAQLATGDHLRFEMTTAESAIAALRVNAAALEMLERAPGWDGPDGAAWAGSLG